MEVFFRLFRFQFPLSHRFAVYYVIHVLLAERRKNAEKTMRKTESIQMTLAAETALHMAWHGIRNVSVTLKMKNNTVLLLLWDLLVSVHWEMFILCMDRKYKYKSDSARRRITETGRQGEREFFRRKIWKLYDFVHVSYRVLACSVCPALGHQNELASNASAVTHINVFNAE